MRERNLSEHNKLYDERPHNNTGRTRTRPRNIARARSVISKALFGLSISILFSIILFMHKHHEDYDIVSRYYNALSARAVPETTVETEDYDGDPKDITKIEDYDASGQMIPSTKVTPVESKPTKEKLAKGNETVWTSRNKKRKKIAIGPKSGIHNLMSVDSSCNVLESDKNDTWDEINTIIDTFPNSDVSGGIFLYPRQQLFLVHLIETQLLLKARKGDQSPFRICETGFGGGHSASLFLSIDDSVQVISFDKFDRPYHSQIIEQIKGQFGESRLHIVKGDSCQTVPQYLQQTDFPGCDFLHGSSLCQYDNIDLIQYSSCGTILTSTAMPSLSDFHVYFGPKAQWRRLRQDECITDITCFTDQSAILDRRYVFNLAKKSQSHAPHQFCFAVNTGFCHHSGVAITSDCATKRNNEPTNSDLFNFCPDVRLKPPI